MAKRIENPNKRRFIRTLAVGGVERPVTVTITLIDSRGSLRGVVRLNYCGMLLGDIRILEDFQGNTIIDFPSREYTVKATQETRKVSVFIPTAQLKMPLNQLIVSCYQEFLADKNTVNNLISDEAISDTDEKPKSKRGKSTASKANKADAVEAEQQEDTVEPVEEKVENEAA